MSESKQPFTDHVTRSKNGPDISRLGWIVAGVMLAPEIFEKVTEVN